MHIEILTEDSSGEKLLRILLPKLFASSDPTLTWRLHPYKGIGHIPKDLKPKGDSHKRILLDQLPRVLRGYGKTPGIDAVIVVLDADQRDCKAFLKELTEIAARCMPPTVPTIFRLAIEETEAWYLGDRSALIAAFPRAKQKILGSYVQDSTCGTWELLADAVHPGGASAIKKAGWPLPGQIKHKWAEKIGPLMNVEKNASPSFGKLRDGIRRLVDPSD